MKFDANRAGPIAKSSVGRRQSAPDWLCARFCLAIISIFARIAGAAEREAIQDNQFRQGFILWAPAPGKHVQYGVMPGFDPAAQPAWGLAQWSSRFPLEPVRQIPGAGSLSLSNTAKSVILQPPDAHLALAVNSAVEYGPASRRAGEPWVHLLVEQEFAHPVSIALLSAAKFHLEARLLLSTNLHRGDYDPAAHAAQFQLFFTLQNRNRESKGYGDYLWFGLPIYDNRYRHPPEFKSRDFGGTEKFIFTPASTNYTAASAQDRTWVTIDRDLLPFLRDALRAAWAQGFLSGSTVLADYAISGMNMGWELPGMFQVEIQTRHLSLRLNSDN